MAYPYSLHEKAYEEYILAYEWYELKANDLGNKFMYYVENKLQHISEYPEHYAKAKGNFRKAKVDNFPT